MRDYLLVSIIFCFNSVFHSLIYFRSIRQKKLVATKYCTYKSWNKDVANWSWLTGFCVYRYLYIIILEISFSTYSYNASKSIIIVLLTHVSCFYFREQILTNARRLSSLRYYLSLLELLSLCAEVSWNDIFKHWENNTHVYSTNNFQSSQFTVYELIRNSCQ